MSVNVESLEGFRCYRDKKMAEIVGGKKKNGNFVTDNMIRMASDN